MQVQDTYIKHSFSLTWRFFTQNKKAGFMILGILFAIMLLSMIPLVNFLTTIALGLFMISVQVYLSKTIMYSKDDADFDINIQNSNPSEIISKFIGVAAGTYLGIIVIEIILFLLLFMSMAMVVGTETLSALGTDALTQQEQIDAYLSLGVFGIVLAIAFLFFGYIYPLVLGRVYMSNTFGEAFKSVFLVFSPSIWKASFNVRYFLLLTVTQLSIIAIVLLGMAFMLSVILIPLILFLIYIVGMLTSATATMSNMLCFEDTHLSENED